MWRLLTFGVILAGLVATGPLSAAGEAPPDPERRAYLRQHDPAGPLPPDLLRPQGRTRWDLTGLTGGRPLRWSLSADGPSVQSALSAPAEDDAVGIPLAGVRLTDPEGGAAALRWLYPDRFPATLRDGTTQHLDLVETVGDAESRVWIRVDTIGSGWLELARGPREVVLQRALILREPAGGRGYTPDVLLHRWVDPRAGVVAEISGPATADGDGRGTVSRVVTLEQLEAGAMDLRIYVDDVRGPFQSRVLIGFDAAEDAGVPISGLTPSAPATMGDLIAGAPGPGGVPLWDFSGITAARKEIFTSSSPINEAETCNFDECGYDLALSDPNITLAREDKLIFSDPNGDPIVPPETFKIHTVAVLEDRGTDVTQWLRAGTINEGRSASSIAARDGESRICYTDQPALMIDRTEVPLFRFPNQDTQGNWYMTKTDPRASSGVFQCEQNIDNRNCGVGPPIGPADLYVTACDGRTGTQYVEPVDAGVVKLPSGHFFNALLLRTVADFCIFRENTCSAFLSKLDEARTVNYLWMAPAYGTVARMQSPQISGSACTGDPDLCFTVVVETDFKFGLFPPLSITAGTIGDTTVDLSWDPGVITGRIDRYKIYWDTEPAGGVDGWDFDSEVNAGQVAPAPDNPAVTAVTIDGLTAGTTYYFTVTSLLDYINPSCDTDPTCNDVVTYESLLFPVQVSSDAGPVYPVEVQATTTGGLCIPTAEVMNVTATLVAPSGDLNLCWDPAVDPCLEGYRVLGAPAPDSAGNFSPAADVDLSTCWTGATSDTFFLTVTRSTDGTGPLGHYGL